MSVLNWVGIFVLLEMFRSSEGARWKCLGRSSAGPGPSVLRQFTCDSRNSRKMTDYPGILGHFSICKNAVARFSR